jgi:hypothetical protein
MDRPLLRGKAADVDVKILGLEASEERWAIRPICSIFLGVALILLAFVPPLIIGADGNSMLAVAESLYQKHTFAVPIGTALSVGGRGGQYYSIMYPLISVLAVPSVALGSGLAHLFHLPKHYIASIFALSLNAVLIAGTAYFTALIAISLGASPKSSAIAALSFAFGTYAFVYARTFCAEPLLALLTAASIAFALGQPRKANSSLSLVTALAVLAKPTGFVLGPICCLYLFARNRSVRDALMPLVGTVCGCLLYLGYNDLRFGGFLRFGHATRGTVQGFTLAVLPWSSLALIASPDCGLVLYCPVLLSLVLLRRELFKRLDILFIIAVAVGYWLIYSPRFDWRGGWSWGPRFLLPTLPGLVAVTGLLELKWRKLLAVLTIIGFAINAPTLGAFVVRYYQEQLLLLGPTAAESRSPWSLSGAPLVGIWESGYHELVDAQHTDVVKVVRDAGGPSNGPADWRALRVVAVWWWMLPAAHIPRIMGALLSLAAIAGGVVLILIAIGMASDEATDGTGRPWELR